MHTAYGGIHEIWEAQLCDIREAQHTILFEQYIVESFEEGEIGRKFIEALIERAHSGVIVNCIFDAVGSLTLFRNSALNERMQQSGIRVFYYKTKGITNIITPARLFLRDHRKLLIIDSAIAWIGGAIVKKSHENYADLMVRFTGEALARTLSDEFHLQIGRLTADESILAPLKKISHRTLLVGNAPGIGNRFCYEEICHKAMLAEKQILFLTPYFAPPLKLTRIIKRCLLRGVRVRLVISRKTDVHLADIAREACVVDLLRCGLDLAYLSGMNHAKIVLVDDSWLSFGSTNIDMLSLVFNHELNISTTEQELISKIQTLIDRWCRGHTQVTAENCGYAHLSFYEKALGHVYKYIA